MTAIVTGASGFLGTAVVKQLRQEGIGFVQVSRRPLSDAVQVRSYSEAPSGDVLIHLAETSDRAAAQQAGAAYADQCAEVMQRLLAKGYQRIVYASSAVVYGDRDDRPRVVGDPVHDADAYAAAKVRVEQMVTASPRTQGIAARIANIYGPGMNANNVISTILRQIPGNGPVRVADTTPIRDFVWIDDVARALVQMAGTTGRGLFNVGTGVGTSILGAARAALAAAGEHERGVVATAPSGHKSALILDITATTDAFGWRPLCPLAGGLARLVSTGEVRA